MTDLVYYDWLTKRIPMAPSEIEKQELQIFRFTMLVMKQKNYAYLQGSSGMKKNKH